MPGTSDRTPSAASVNGPERPGDSQTGGKPWPDGATAAMSYYGPRAQVECEAGHVDGDCFPGTEREWVES